MVCINLKTVFFIAEILTSTADSFNVNMYVNLDCLIVKFVQNTYITQFEIGSMYIARIIDVFDIQ